MSGQGPLIVDSITALKPHVDCGRLKALAVTSLAATSVMPGVKPVAEQGIAGFELDGVERVPGPRVRRRPSSVPAQPADFPRHQVTPDFAIAAICSAE